MDCCTPGYPVYHQLPELAQTHVHQVGDAILCRLLLLLLSIFPSIRIFSNKSVLCIRWPKYWSFASASVLAMNIQHWFPLGWTGLVSLQSKGLSRVLSSTTVQKHLFFGAQLSLWSNSHIHTWSLKKNIALTIRTFVGKDGVVLALIWKITDYSSSKLQELMVSEATKRWVCWTMVEENCKAG